MSINVKTNSSTDVFYCTIDNITIEQSIKTQDLKQISSYIQIKRTGKGVKQNVTSLFTY